ncbi:MAG: phosphatase PAP2 family protein [Acidimicrobiales bacterium]
MRQGLPEAVVRRTNPVTRYGLRLTLAIVAILLVTVPFSFLLFQVLLEGPLTEIDGDLADRLNHAVRDNDAAVTALQAVSRLGWPPVLWIVAASSILYTWRQGALRLSVFLLATTVGGGVLSTVVKVLVDRPRPLVDHPVATALGKSFPSGHALSSTVVYGAVLLTFLPVLSRRLRHLAVALTVVLVLAIGASRLALGVHFLSDVVGGYVLGVAWLVAATAVFETWRVDRGRRPSHPLEEGVEPEEAPALQDEGGRVTRV